ncbi:MAG: MFS transporter [Planctomycetes bacterium]|nr:MFS transporter [Planctomycetota bacterium]
MERMGLENNNGEAEERAAAEEGAGRDGGVAGRSLRNSAVYIVRDVSWRLGWMFKNEGLVVSSFLKTVGVSNGVLSLLPVLNRCGRAIPQLAVAGMVGRVGRKKFLSAAGTGIFGAIWLVLGYLVHRHSWQWSRETVLWVTFALYFPSMMFFAGAVLAGQVLRGKLIPVNWRGRVMSVAAFVGVPLGIAATIFVLRPILARDGIGLQPYGTCFMVSGAVFLVVSVITLAFAEEADAPRTRRISAAGEALRAMRKDADFRGMVLIRMGTFVAFGALPFYTAYGYEVSRSVGVEWKTLIALCMVALQVGKLLGVAATGWIADRLGNRAATVFTLVMGMVWPMSALWTGWLVKAGLADVRLYLVTYVIQGLAMPVFYISTNYLLEAAPEEKRPAYMAMGNTAMLIALPVLPVLGVMADRLGLEALLAIMGVFTGWLCVLALRMGEPRGRLGIPGTPVAP